MIAERLLENWLWRDYQEIDSTNNLAKAQSLAFDGRPVVYTAVVQTAGRGRLGRSWISRPGNLFMSQLFCPRLPVSDLVFITSVSVAETITGLTSGLDIAIKWPNDVLIAGAKICGILIESADNETVVIGTGVNLVSAPPAGQLIYPAADLRSLGFDISREFFLAAYLRHFDANLELCRRQGFSAIRKTWLKYAYRLGKPVKINHGGRVLEGIFKGIDEQGFLLLKQDEKTIKITVGDLLA